MADSNTRAATGMPPPTPPFPHAHPQRPSPRYIERPAADSCRRAGRCLAPLLGAPVGGTVGCREPDVMHACKRAGGGGGLSLMGEGFFSTVSGRRLFHVTELARAPRCPGAPPGGRGRLCNDREWEHGFAGCPLALPRQPVGGVLCCCFLFFLFLCGVHASTCRHLCQPHCTSGGWSCGWMD